MATKFKDELYLKLQIATKEAKELKKSLKTTELSLARAKIEKESLFNSLQETDDLNKKLEGALESALSRADTAENLNSSLSSELKLQREETEKLQSHTKDLENKLEESYVQSKQTLENFHQLIEAFNTCKSILKVDKASDLVHKLKLFKEENARLQLDNVKLMQVVSSPRKLKTFANLAQDSNGVTFVPAAKYKKRLSLSQVRGEWIPADIIKSFRELNKQKFNTNEVSDLLKQVNKLWIDRENNRIGRVKVKFQKKIAKAKKSTVNSDLEKRTCYTSLSPKKTPDLQQDIRPIQEEFIEILCDRVEEFCELIGKDPQNVRNSQEWFVDQAIKLLNSYSTKFSQLF